MNKSKEQRESFTVYCLLHPEERFWQALRNWNQIENPKHNFILTAEINNNPRRDDFWMNTQDTFYK